MIKLLDHLQETIWTGATSRMMAGEVAEDEEEEDLEETMKEVLVVSVEVAPIHLEAVDASSAGKRDTSQESARTLLKEELEEAGRAEAAELALSATKRVIWLGNALIQLKMMMGEELAEAEAEEVDQAGL